MGKLRACGSREDEEHSFFNRIFQGANMKYNLIKVSTLSLVSLTCLGAFHKDAQVDIGTGTIPISRINPGQPIHTFSPRLAAIGKSYVQSRTIATNSGFIVEINVGDRIITAMPRQLLFDVATQKFVQARKLRSNHVLLGSDSALVNIEDVKIKRRRSLSYPHEISVGHDHTLFVDGVLNHNVWPVIGAIGKYLGMGALGAGAKRYGYDPVFEALDRRVAEVGAERARGAELVNSGRAYVDVHEGLPIPMEPNYRAATPENSANHTIRKSGMVVPGLNFGPATSPSADNLNSPFNGFNNPNHNPHSFGMGRGGRRDPNIMTFAVASERGDLDPMHLSNAQLDDLRGANPDNFREPRDRSDAPKNRNYEKNGAKWKQDARKPKTREGKAAIKNLEIANLWAINARNNPVEEPFIRTQQESLAKQTAAQEAPVVADSKPVAKRRVVIKTVSKPVDPAVEPKQETPVVAASNPVEQPRVIFKNACRPLDPVIEPKVDNLKMYRPSVVDEPVKRKFVPTPEIVNMKPSWLAVGVCTKTHMAASELHREDLLLEAQRRSDESIKYSDYRNSELYIKAGNSQRNAKIAAQVAEKK